MIKITDFGLAHLRQTTHETENEKYSGLYISYYKASTFADKARNYRVTHKKVEHSLHVVRRLNNWAVPETIRFDHCSESWTC